MSRTPEQGHSRACLAAALIAAVENLRDANTDLRYSESLLDHDFRLAVQDNIMLLEADENLASGVQSCTCPSDADLGDAWAQAMSDYELLAQYPLSFAAVGPAADNEVSALTREISRRGLKVPSGRAPLVHKITSGEEPTVGLRVFTNDWTWGTITEVGEGLKCGTYCEAWHHVELDSGARKTYNCDRLTTRKPA